MQKSWPVLSNPGRYTKVRFHSQLLPHIKVKDLTAKVTGIMGASTEELCTLLCWNARLNGGVSIQDAFTL